MNRCFQKEEMIEKYFIRHLYTLANDKVVNVRITLAKVISREIFKRSNYLNNQSRDKRLFFLSTILSSKKIQQQYFDFLIF